MITLIIIRDTYRDIVLRNEKVTRYTGYEQY
jgi:hypothetical protein